MINTAVVVAEANVVDVSVAGDQKGTGAVQQCRSFARRFHCLTIEVIVVAICKGVVCVVVQVMSIGCGVIVIVVLIVVVVIRLVVAVDVVSGKLETRAAQ